MTIPNEHAIAVQEYSGAHDSAGALRRSTCRSIYEVRGDQVVQHHMGIFDRTVVVGWDDHRNIAGVSCRTTILAQETNASEPRLFRELDSAQHIRRVAASRDHD